jgi:chromosomal replication initiator protein
MVEDQQDNHIHQLETGMDARQLWLAALADLETRISRGAFDNWLRQTSLTAFDDDVATIAAPNAFSASTLQGRYAGQIERALSDIVGRRVTARFAVGGRDADEPVPPTLQRTAANPSEKARRLAPTRNGQGAATGQGGQAGAIRRLQQMALEPTAAHGLNPRLTYETYVVGGSNRFAHAASLAVAEHPGGKFNPFFVHGGVGLGKTHLIHAIGHRALVENPELTIVYVSSETFTNDLINAIRAQRMEEFRNRYRTIDILMIDDIQFIAGKESTQEEFFHTFNALYQSGKQVIISSDKPPRSIAALEDRLRSRFEGGLIADVGLPDYEMRTAILRSKAEELRIKLPDDVVEYVAHRDQTNIRELEGALNKILMTAELYGRPLSLQLAMEALTDAAISQRRSTLTTAEVLDAVTGYYGVPEKDLLGRLRKREIVLPRQVAMYLMREATDGSLVDIGHALGGRDHTTVIHGIEKIERELATDTALRTQVMAIRETLLTGSRR